MELMDRKPFEYRLRLVRVAGIGPILALAMLMVAWGPGAAAHKAPNPHWKADSCAACHGGGAKKTISAQAADEICLSCHDGRKAAMEFHPVSRALDEQKYARPAGWPLIDGRLACVTCHDLKVGCVEGINVAPRNRMMLRNFQEGRNRSQPFCQNCHKEATYQKINPHLMLLPDGKEIIEEKCLFCHSKLLDRGALGRTGKPSLKIDESSLCRDCHPQHKDSMNQTHIGMKVSGDMLAMMYLREITGLRSQVGAPSMKAAAAAGKRPARMPLAAGDVISCSTCHNPHQQGVFPNQSKLAYRAMRVTDDNKTVSPVHNQVWCRHCHEF